MFFFPRIDFALRGHSVHPTPVTPSFVRTKKSRNLGAHRTNPLSRSVMAIKLRVRVMQANYTTTVVANMGICLCTLATGCHQCSSPSASSPLTRRPSLSSGSTMLTRKTPILLGFRHLQMCFLEHLLAFEAFLQGAFVLWFYEK